MQYLQQTFSVYMGTAEYRQKYDQIDWSKTENQDAGQQGNAIPREQE